MLECTPNIKDAIEVSIRNDQNVLG
jgi:hypothetical protein